MNDTAGSNKKVELNAAAEEEKVVLGIETSCDDTGVALVSSSRRVLAEELSSNMLQHLPYGGIVPIIASRDHESATWPGGKRSPTLSSSCPCRCSSDCRAWYISIRLLIVFPDPPLF